MPKIATKSEFELQTRDRYTKVECEIAIRLTGKELPAAGILGEALEKCAVLLQEHVAQSYAVVPERV